MATLVAGSATFNTTSGSKTVVITPAVGEILVVFVANTGQTGTPGITDDQGGTYANITNALKNVSADRMFAFIRTTLIPAAVSTTITMTPGATTGGGLLVMRIAGMQKLGAAAARASGKQENQAAATPAPAFPQAALTTNLVTGAIFNSTSPAAMTPPSGWIERGDTGYATPTTGLEVATRDSGETGTTITWGSASASEFAALILELDASIAATASPSVVAAIGAVPSAALSGVAVAGPSSVAAVASVPSATAKCDAVAAPAVVAAVASVPEPSASGGTSAMASPASVAVIASVPSVVALGAAVAAPTAVTAIASVPSGVSAGAGVTTQGVIAGIASVPTPTARGAAVASPVLVAAIGGVPSPAVLAQALALPPGITLAAFIPAPDARGAGIAGAERVAAIVSIPSPLAVGGVVAQPQTVAAVAMVSMPLAGELRDLVWHAFGLSPSWSMALAAPAWNSAIQASGWPAEIAKE